MKERYPLYVKIASWGLPNPNWLLGFCLMCLALGIFGGLLVIEELFFMLIASVWYGIAYVYFKRGNGEN